MLMHSITTRSFHGPNDAYAEQLQHQHQQGHVMLYSNRDIHKISKRLVAAVNRVSKIDFLVSSPDLRAVKIVGFDIQEHRIARDFYRSSVVYSSIVAADVLSFHHHQ